MGGWIPPILNPSTFNAYSDSLNHSEHHVVGTYPFDSNTILELSINLMSYSIHWLACPYPLVSSESSIFLRTMLPEKMIIPSDVMKLHNLIGQGQEVNTHLLFRVWHTHWSIIITFRAFDFMGKVTWLCIDFHFRRIWSGVQGSLAVASNWTVCCENTQRYTFQTPSLQTHPTFVLPFL